MRCALAVALTSCLGELGLPYDDDSDGGDNAVGAYGGQNSGLGGPGGSDGGFSGVGGFGTGAAGGTYIPPADACESASDDRHCGENLSSEVASAGVLYTCHDGLTVHSEFCSEGCETIPAGPDDCVEVVGEELPTGKGIWIWRFGTSAPSPAVAAQKASDLGVGFVLIKSGEDTSTWQTNFNPTIIAEFTSRGIWVFGWNYVRPGNIAAKADAIAAQANLPGVKGMVLDVEIEWEGTGKEDEAIELCEAIRAQTPGRMLGFSSFGWIAYHPGIPWLEFDEHCGDMHLPQTYWDAWDISRTDGYQKAIDGAQALGLTAPIWAVQDNYEGTPTSTELNTFFSVAGPFSSLWRWPNPGDTALSEQLEQLDWVNP